jgi:glycosyltransferase involved in cell wall biosynthesis
MKETFLNEFNHNSCINPQVIKVVPYGVDTDFFTPGTEVNGQSREIYSNRRFEPVCDPVTVIDGFSAAYHQNPDIHLTLRSNGSQKRAILDRLNSPGIRNIVQILDWGTPAEVREDLHHAGIFVSTTLSDGSATSVLEAMSCGLTCIATRVGGIPEWIHDGENGFLIPAHSPHDLSERIAQVVRDPELRARIGKNARETVLKTANWNCIMDNVEKDYALLING